MRPCPFCRANYLELLLSEHNSYYVFCKKCCTTGPRSIDQKIATYLWDKPSRINLCNKCYKDKDLNGDNLCEECAE